MKRHQLLRYAHSFASLLLVSGVFSTQLAASNPVRIVRVEEDWELKVLTPDTNSAGPQVTCILSPCGEVDCVYGTFELNHRSVPSYVPSGLHLQAWCGQEVVSVKSSHNTGLITTPGETVFWTQRMDLTEGVLFFEIVSGTSSTWGSFGGQGHLKTHVNSTVSDLNGYDPEVSAANSGVGYAANRVQHLILRRVRLVTDNGQVIEYNTPRNVHVSEN